MDSRYLKVRLDFEEIMNVYGRIRGNETDEFEKSIEGGVDRMVVAIREQFPEQLPIFGETLVAALEKLDFENPHTKFFRENELIHQLTEAKAIDGLKAVVCDIYLKLIHQNLKEAVLEFFPLTNKYGGNEMSLLLGQYSYIVDLIVFQEAGYDASLETASLQIRFKLFDIEYE